MQQPPRKTQDSSGEDLRMAVGVADLRSTSSKRELAGQGSVDIPAAIRKRPYLTVATLLVCMLAGAAYVLRRRSPVYHAEATIYISPTYFKNLQDDREQLQISYSTLVNQQILTIRRFDILNEAKSRLEKRGIHWTRAGETDEAAVRRLGWQLDIQRIPDSYEILVGLNGEKREGLAEIVNTVVNTYLEKGKGDDLSDRANRLAALTAEKANVAAELQRKLNQQADLSKALMLVNVDKSTPSDDALLASARQAQEEARRARIEAEAQLSIMEGERNGSTKNPLTALAEETVTNDSNLRNLTNTLVQRRLALKAQIAGLLPEHPLRQTTEKELAEIDDQLTRLPQGMMAQVSNRVLAKLRGEVEKSRRLESDLELEVLKQAAKLKGVTKELQLAQGLSQEIDRLRQHQNLLGGRMDDLAMLDGTPEFLHLFSAAQMPLEPNKNESKKALIALLGLAAFLSVVTAVAMDLVDQRILSASEVRRVIGFPPVGMVIEWDMGTRAFAEEHFRRLINGIQRGIAAQGAKTIVFTPLAHSRTPGFLVTDIGRSLVARGMKTVILDANPLRDEELASGSPAEILALGDVSRSGIQFGDSRVAATIEIISPKEISHLPTVTRMGAALEELSKEYDVILIDAPPLRLSADAEFLASIGDMTLAVVEAGDATRRDLDEGASLLSRIGASSVGVIMSQVRLKHADAAMKRDFKRFSGLTWSTATEGMHS